MNRRDQRPACRGGHVWFALRRLSVATSIQCVVVLAAVAPTTGAQEPPRIADLRAGFAGRFKVGSWAPFEVTVRSGSEPLTGQVELTVLDGDGVPSRVQSPEESVRIGPGETISVPLVAKVGQLRGDVTVSLRAGGRPLASRTFSTGDDGPLGGIMRWDQRLIVTLGGPLNQADQAHLAARHATIAQLKAVSELPTQWFGFEGVDVVIVATADEALGSQLTLASPQMAALDQWVRMGGTLVLSVGSRAAAVLASGAPLAEIAPGKLAGMVPLKTLTGFEAYADANEPLELPDARAALQVPKLEQVQGRIEAHAGRNPHDLPLVVRAAHGFGQVVFLAFDLDRPPLSDWKGRAALLDKLWPPKIVKSSEGDSGMLGEVTTLGFVDLAGQLRGALDQFSGVPLVPFWLIAALVLAYIVCAGPLDYYLVQRLLGRPEATWLTFVLTLVTFSVGACALTIWLKGRDVRLNQVDLVDFDAQTKLVRGTTWCNLFSPATESYDLSLRPATRFETSTGPPRTILSWLGTTGSGLGSMNPQAASLGLFSRPYDFSPRLDHLERVPLAVWSSKAFVARWWIDLASPIDARLTDRVEKGKLTGTLESHLSEPLADAVLLYDRWAYRWQQLQPQRQVDIERVDPQTIETYLHRVRLQGDRSISPPYDRESFDVPRIVEVMSFHELAGGEKYTGLENEHQGFADLSPLVACGRAILVARSLEPAAELMRDQSPLESQGRGQWTFYRFVLPVDRDDRQ